MNEKPKRFYELEEPILSQTESGVIRFYPNAQRLQLQRPPWTNKQGEECHGKTVTLHVGAFIGNPDAITVLERVLAMLKGGDADETA